MTDAILRLALTHWGLSDAPATLIAARENKVYRVDSENGPVALRLHRPGLRSTTELRSELQWMGMLAAGGITVPDPVPAPDGSLYFLALDTVVDVLRWLDGEPMGQDGTLAALPNPHAAYHALGRTMAQMHDLADAWTPPKGFMRMAWDRAGLVGEAPLWGRFWENPQLGPDERLLLLHARELADTRLQKLAGQADYGLIHADLVPENVLLQRDQPALIDFDDGGFGYRLFDLATVSNRADREDASGTSSAALLAGYLEHRKIDLTDYPLFKALRSFTYVGWMIARAREPGAAKRNARHIRAACTHAHMLLDT